MDKTAENTLTAIEAIVEASAKDSTLGAEKKITLDNAVGKGGKLIAESGVMTGADTGSKVQTALGIQAGIVVKGLVTAKVADTTKAVNPGKLGTAKTSDGKYMLVVIVNEISDN